MMETAHWFRWHHGCVTDPKFRVIALRCVTSVTVGQVIAIWAAMLECASQATPRGELVGWSDEDVAVLFGFSEEQVSGIREAMQGKTLEGNRLIAWGIRQPARNDDSKDRVREWRSRQRGVTHGNAAKRTVTRGNARGEESREDKKEQKQKTCSTGVERFAEFWSAYPRKVGKASAEKTWAKIGPDPETVKDMLAAIAVQRESEQWSKHDGQFIPHPATWLNGRRWEDEGIVPAQHADGPGFVGTPRKRRELGT